MRPEETAMDSASSRMVVIQSLIAERHLDPNRASWAAVAMFPFDDTVRAGRKFRKEAGRASDTYARQLEGASDELVELLTLATLEHLRDTASMYGEGYYANHFASILALAADPETPTLERKCSNCNSWFTGLEPSCASCGRERKKVTISTV
jgi:hypothetical protein